MLTTIAIVTLVVFLWVVLVDNKSKDQKIADLYAERESIKEELKQVTNRYNRNNYHYRKLKENLLSINYIRDSKLTIKDTIDKSLNKYNKAR